MCLNPPTVHAHLHVKNRVTCASAGLLVILHFFFIFWVQNRLVMVGVTDRYLIAPLVPDILTSTKWRAFSTDQGNRFNWVSWQVLISSFLAVWDTE